MRRYIFIALGGILGASVRWALNDILSDAGFHWSIFAVNAFGCLALGVLLGEEARTARYRLWLQDFGAIGFCGGLTTMSTFSLDVVQLLDHHRYAIALFYFWSNVVAGLLLVGLGAKLVKRIAAVERPVEQLP